MLRNLKHEDQETTIFWSHCETQLLRMRYNFRDFDGSDDKWKIKNRLNNIRDWK